MCVCVCVCVCVRVRCSKSARTGRREAQIRFKQRLHRGPRCFPARPHPVLFPFPHLPSLYTPAPRITLPSLSLGESDCVFLNSSHILRILSFRSLPTVHTCVPMAASSSTCRLPSLFVPHCFREALRCDLREQRGVNHLRDRASLDLLRWEARAQRVCAPSLSIPSLPFPKYNRHSVAVYRIALLVA